MDHYNERGATSEWLLMSADLRADGGHSIEFRDGRVIVDGMASVSTWRSARELINEFNTCPARRIDGDVDQYLA